MKIASLHDGSVENRVEAAGFEYSEHASTVATKPGPETDVVTPEVDDRKTPPVFGRLWRECISLFTLAFAPGLNVSTPVE